MLHSKLTATNTHQLEEMGIQKMVVKFYPSFFTKQGIIAKRLTEIETKAAEAICIEFQISNKK